MDVKSLKPECVTTGGPSGRAWGAPAFAKASAVALPAMADKSARRSGLGMPRLKIEVRTRKASPSPPREGTRPTMLMRLLSGRRWDYAGGYAGISGRKTGRFPLNPGYSRVIPHNEFQNFLRALRQGADARFEYKATLQVIYYSTVTAILHLISSFFSPFLSHKHLVSRRLRIKHGLFEFAEEIAEFESSKNAERIPIISCEAGGACTHLERQLEEEYERQRRMPTLNIFLSGSLKI